MSLLMDALKRAEANKQEASRAGGGKEEPTAGSDLSLEPIAPEPTKAAHPPLPDLATHLDAVDADLADTATRPEAPPPMAGKPQIATPSAKAQAEQMGRDAARNAFAAKQAASTPSKAPLWLALGTLGIAGAAIGLYVWYQLSALGGNAPLQPATRQAAPPALSSAPAPAAPFNPPLLAPPQTLASAGSNPPAGEARLFSPPPAEPRPPRTPAAAPERGADTPIRLTRTRPEADANLLQGHVNVQQNDLDLARRNFEQTLQRDPNNTDALLALAAIAQRQGRPGDAEYLYQRALVANPSDPAVQGAILNGATAGADPQNTESRLKTLLSAQPDSAPLNFALGNLYARQKRWSEAQQVFFNAVAADSDNPDYLFNLAVSLDHIRQGRPAAQHYRLALEAAGKRPAAFDREQVRRRLTELQPERQP